MSLNPYPKRSRKVLPHRFGYLGCGAGIYLAQFPAIGDSDEDYAIACNRRIERKLHGQIADVQPSFLAPLPHLVCARHHRGVVRPTDGRRYEIPVLI